MTNVDFTKPSNRPVKDFAFFKDRMQPIDYQAIIDNREDWKDPFFPPTYESMVDPDMESNATREKWKKYTWKRPEEIWGEGKFILFHDKIEPTDIKQGHMGDCYFLSCLAAIAEFPERIKRMFVTQTTNTAGIYAVNFWVAGEKRVVVVDDYFPYDESKEEFAFSRPASGNEIWVLILEKAWAKLYGSYSRIEIGDCGEAMQPLTGCPAADVIFKNYKNKENLWKVLAWADKNKFMMCCAANTQEEDEVDEDDMK